MGLNGSGVYSPPNPPVFPAVAGEVVRASYFNQIINDISATLSSMVARDGQSTITGVLQWSQPAANLAALGGVALTGAQTIAGVKTFSSAPVSSAAASAANELMRKGEVDSAVAAAVPSGAVMPFARNTAPSGWLKCDGSLVSRTTYAALFAAIGTTFGAGDGSTTFALPDLRGEFVRGWADGRGVDNGRVLGSWQGDELKAHNHSPHQWWAYSNDTTDSHRPGGTIPHLTRDGEDYWGNRNQEVCVTNGGAETRPRNIALLYCIKT